MKLLKITILISCILTIVLGYLAFKNVVPAYWGIILLILVVILLAILKYKSPK